MSVRNSIAVIPLSTIDAATLQTLVYKPLNITGLPSPCFLLRISNLSNSLIWVSFDGVNDNEIMNPSRVTEIYGGQGQPQNNSALFNKGQVIYVRGNAGVGLIGVSGFYQPLGQ